MDYSPWSSKNLIPWNLAQKIMQVGVDVTCIVTPILVGMASVVSEILLPSKTANFPFLTMDYSRSVIKKFN